MNYKNLVHEIIDTYNESNELYSFPLRIIIENDNYIEIDKNNKKWYLIRITVSSSDKEILFTRKAQCKSTEILKKTEEYFFKSIFFNFFNAGIHDIYNTMKKHSKNFK